MDLHGQIMNLNCVPQNMGAEPNQRLAYKVGHRDARHAAAELALKADAKFEAADAEKAYWLAKIGGLQHALDRSEKLANDRLAQMADDRAQALKWRDEAQRLRGICVGIHDGLLRGDDDKELMALAAQGWWKA